ncbi:MAG: AAA family ATPase [Thermoguttaceae bacterium]|jgi:type II secretory pathway predicted ATPase ExeA
MYQSHWGLRESPFQGDSAVPFLHQSPTHEEALARLQFLVENHRRLGLLTGASGSGKTLVLEAFAGQLRRRGRPVVKINLLGVEPAEMLFLLAAGLKLNPEPSTSLVALWRAITDRLTEFYYQKLDTVILLDDADCADDRVLAQVARLARHEPSSESRLTLILAGRREKIGRLGDRLLELAELRIDLEPWNQTDTANYLNTSLTHAGSKSPVFSESAIDRLHDLTHGIPRRAAQLADLSLLAGAGANLPQIDADVVESVYHELAVTDER